MASRGQKRKVAASAAIPWTPEKAAFALGNVKVTPFDATTGLRCVGKNSLAEAIKGNISRTGTTKEGKVIWINILKRDNCQLPLPDIYSAKLEGGDRAADVFEAQDVPDAVHKLVGAKDATDFFGSALFVAALKQCMERCGLRDLSTLDQVVAEVAARASKTQEQLEIFKIPELLQSEEGSEVFAQMRLYKDDDGLMLISAHNQIKWLGMDDNKKHNEWHNWLCGALQEYIEYNYRSNTDEYGPRLKYVKLDGESNPTPMYCVKCFYQVIIMSIGKSKLARDTALKAVNLYGRYLVGDQRLHQEIKANAHQAPHEAKDFVIGWQEANRQAVDDGCALMLTPKKCTCELKHETAQKKLGTDNKKLCIEDTWEMLSNIVISKTGLSGAVAKLRLHRASATFIELMMRENPDLSKTALQKKYRADAFGNTTRVPLTDMCFALAAIEQTEYQNTGLIVAEGPSANCSPNPKQQRFKIWKRSRFLARANEHGCAKDRANELWIQQMPQLLRGKRVFYLDEFKNAQGCVLRTTTALLARGFEPAQLYSANPDAGVFEALRKVGAHAFHGTWQDWREDIYYTLGPIAFDGIYLDLCTGSVGYAAQQLDLGMARAAPGCIMAWTITERNYEGEDLLLRAFQLADLLSSRGWTPSCGGLRGSTLLYRSGVSGQRVLTQLWRSANV